jgi:hypothetical protein
MTAYPKEFIDELKRLFPSNSYGIFEKAEAGSDFIGRFLDDNHDFPDATNEILNAKTLIALQDKARRARDISLLYSTYWDIREGKYNGLRK